MIIEKIMQETCEEKRVKIEEIRSGSRRRVISETRRLIANSLVNDYGTPISEVARHVGVTAAAVLKAVGHHRK
jgi:chromosomal replication initiation ATPase DnaA